MPTDWAMISSRSRRAISCCQLLVLQRPRAFWKDCDAPLAEQEVVPGLTQIPIQLH
jgi:hypothetical protein